MGEPVKRRSLRANQNKPKTPKAHKCDEHGTTLVFDPITNTWQCPHEDCDKRLYPKAEVDRFGKPTIVDARGDTGEPVLCVINADNSQAQLPQGTAPTYGIRFPSSNTIVVLPTSLVTKFGNVPTLRGSRYELTLQFKEMAMYTSEDNDG